MSPGKLLVIVALAIKGQKSLLRPALDRLPVGAIQPKGWLKDQLTLMTTGLTGGLPFWTQGAFASSGWIGMWCNSVFILVLSMLLIIHNSSSWAGDVQISWGAKG